MSTVEPTAMSVSELTGHLKAVIEQTFPAVVVTGEISDLARPRSGHAYFTLKDDHAQIRGVIWRSVASRLQFDLADGQEVLCQGDVEVYAARGSYQLIVRKVQPLGLGGLQLAFSQLQAKLQAEGLFAAERKRELPRHPQRIAVITSTTSAAIRDFLEAASHRWRGVEIVVIPAVVQGQSAARSIVTALASAQRYQPRLDLVILTRGGGSLEDLWCFNEEAVVRAIAGSEIPTVSAIGHEIDVTLSDFAADLRALTPTDAATKALPDGVLLERTLTALRQRLDQSARSALRSRRQRLDSIAQRPVMRNPFELVHDRARPLDEIDARARRAMFERLRQQHAAVQQFAASLSALSPLNVLARGYSVTTGPAGNVLQDSSGVAPNDLLTTRLRRGQVVSKVLKTQPAAEVSQSQQKA